eukprot:GHRR01031960.1.p2 GENE.GHRR01031960.1~~GHRR01031960.1.p2  ORF type:complete len:145 (+),score=19.79 GHRR01031960.1:287-721(+)
MQDDNAQTACVDTPAQKSDAAAEAMGQREATSAPVPGARNWGYNDQFMMNVFKVEPCTRADKHPRGSCPYAHPGDVARRRHPSRYQALLCPEVRAVGLRQLLTCLQGGVTGVICTVQSGFSAWCCLLRPYSQEQLVIIDQRVEL